MILYHGTTGAIAKKALTEGLKPRIMTGKSNWKHTVSSNPSMVYLTSVYAPYFAICASNDTESIGIVEVDISKLNTNLLRPDEDFIEQVSRHVPNLTGNIGKKMIERTKNIRKNIDKFFNLWKNSIELIGTCAFKGHIPVSAIKGAVTIDRVHSVMEFNALDPTISIMNFQLCKKQYEILTQWFLGYPVSFKEWLESKRLDQFITLNKDLETQLEPMKEILLNQKGIKRLL